MGRRGNMRSRPGLLFVIVFAVCLVVVYLSWRSLMTPGIKVKDTYSVPVQTLLDKGSRRRNIDGNPEEPNLANHDRDPDYYLDNANKKPKIVGDTLRQFDFQNNRGNFLNKQQPVPDLQTPRKQTFGSERNSFYRQPNKNLKGIVKSMERLVHLDLKGAPPKMAYLRNFIPLVRKLGATGLLIEYEDMFPYTGMLKSISAKNAYSMENIKEILELAELNNLKVMPLIQTFGHMEFVLKSEYIYLRERAYSPQVIDITQNATYALISEMVKQILKAHPNATHLHIGCDEVYELGKGASGLEMQSKKLSASQIFIRHVQHVSDIVRRYSNKGVQPVIWDDELRHVELNEIENSRLPSVVEIMVWQYTKNVSDAIGSDVWGKYAKLFKSIWIASAFKGATGPRQFFTEPQYHIQNHFSWLDVIEANYQKLTFKGIALTGWQRYDHFATLCELLPVAVPSLAVCLATMMNAGFTKEIHITTSKLIDCSNPLEMTFPQINKKTGMALVTQDCRFPGHELYHAIQELYGYAAGMKNVQNRLDGWMSDYQIEHGFSNPGQLKALSDSMMKLSSGYNMVSVPLKRHLAAIYFDDVVEEWIDENIEEHLRHINGHQEKVQALQLRKTWPQRPLPKPEKTFGSISGDKQFQKGQFERTTSNQLDFLLAQRKFQNINEFQKRPVNNNNPDLKSVPDLQNQDIKRLRNPFIRNSIEQNAPVNSNTVNKNNQFSDRDGNFRANKDLPEAVKLEEGRRAQNVLDKVDRQRVKGALESNVDRQRVKGALENSKDRNISQNNMKVANQQTDYNNENLDLKSEKYRMADAIGSQGQGLPRFAVESKLDEDDQMRREKYLNEGKNNEPAENLPRVK